VFVLSLCSRFDIVVMSEVVSLNFGENEPPEKNIWEVLVGAFSDFGGLDTDNPVQISAIFTIFTLFRFPEGLI